MKKKAEKLLAKVIPFELWKKLISPTDQQIKNYWLIVNELKKGARDGFPTEISSTDLIGSGAKK